MFNGIFFDKTLKDVSKIGSPVVVLTNGTIAGNKSPSISIQAVRLYCNISAFVTITARLKHAQLPTWNLTCHLTLIE